MKKYLKIKLLTIFLFVCNLSFAQQADIDIVFNRIYTDYYNGNFKASDVNTWLNTLSVDGKWTDIAKDYIPVLPKTPLAYAPATHLARTNAIILAYVKNIPGNTFYNQPWVLDKIKLALNVSLTYGHATTFDWNNWYNIYIAHPSLYAAGLILLKKNISATEMQPYIAYLQDILSFPGVNKTGTGANQIWEAGNEVLNGAIKNDYTMIQKGFQATASTLEFMDVQGNAGIQRDYSWHEHGPQLYSGGYGFFILGNYINHIKYSKGTSFETIFPQPKIDMLSNLLLEGHQWLCNKTNYDFGSTGRDISRVDGTQGIYTSILDNMITIDPSRASKYSAWKTTRTGGVSAVVGNKHFFKSDVMVHRGANYYLSVKVPSLRTQGTEQMNSENYKSSFLPLGSTQIYTRGNEYNNIYPLWDWSRIPGTTTENKELIHTPIDKDFPIVGTNSFGGGVSSGTMGFMAFKGTYNAISANKAYFYIGDAMFCMGSGITGNKTAGIVTSVNQAFPNGTITVNNGTTQTFTTGAPNYSNIAWIHHDNVGYIFPNGGLVTVQNIQQKSDSGTWKNIGTYTNTINPANIFSVWINHGTVANNATYQYIVAPDKNLAAFQTFAANPGFLVVQNDGNIQAIRNTNYNVDAIVFYNAGTVNMGDGLTVKVDKPSLVLVEKNSSGYKITVSDPTYTAANTAVTVTINSKANVINLPTGPFLGSSASLTVINTVPIKQSISLKAGWNLISTNVQPADSSIATLFTGLDVKEIKTANVFWRKGQNVAFNSLKSITSGQGYLVNMNVAGTLTVIGTPSVETRLIASLHTGWQMIGCPFQTSTALSSLFTTTNTFTVKNLDGFWIPGGTLNSITNLEMGKGYFVKIK